MPLASTSRVQLRTALEATFGSVTAATGRRKVRMAGDTLNYNLNFDQSKEIRPDRQVSDQILLSCAAQGGFNFEMSYREFDTFIEDALQQTFVAFNTSAGVSPTLTTPTFTNNTLTQTGGTTFITIEKGQWLVIAGCTAGFAVNNGMWESSRSVAATATVITFEGTPFATTGAATGTVTISTSRSKNGLTQRSRLLEAEFNDITKFLTFRGMTLNKWSMNFQAGSMATGNFDFTGVDVVTPLSGASNIPSTDDVTYPSTFDVMNCTRDIFKLYEGGAALTGTFAKSLTFDVDNKLRSQTAMQNLGPVGFGQGTYDIKGKLSAYFANSTLYDKFTQNNATAIAVVIKDPSGNGYAITFPAVEITNADITRGSLDQDIMVDLDFAAKIDSVSGKMLLVDRCGAAV